MKIRTKDLIGPALNWAVARVIALGTDQLRIIGQDVLIKNCDDLILCRFSTDWDQAGPIIDREDIHWGFGTKDGNKVVIASKFGHHVKPLLGPTPLIAAMRCFVESRLGDKVEIPAAFAIQERR